MSRYQVEEFARPHVGEFEVTIRGIISPTLMNMTLDGLERTLRARFGKNTRKPVKVNIVRYADDFIITGATREVLADEVRPIVEQFLAERGLSLSPEKTRITHIDDGFDFLGMNVRKYRGTLLIKPAKANVQRFLRKLRDIVKNNATAKQDWLIRQLNPLIRGWANTRLPLTRSTHNGKAISKSVLASR